MNHALARSGALLLLLFGLALGVRAEVPVPPLKSPVTDLTNTLSAAQKEALEQKLLAFEKRKGSQVFVLIVPTTQPEAIEQYAIRVADAWKPGRKGVDDGALLVVAKDDRTLRIDTRYGLEGVLTDAMSKRIVDDIIVPRFKAGDFAGGIDTGVDWMIKLIDGEPLPAPSVKQSVPGDMGNKLESLLMIGVMLVFVVGGVLRRIIGRMPAAILVSGAAGVAAWLIVGALAVGVIAAIIALVFSLAAGNSGLPMRGGRGGWGGGFPGGGGGWSSGGGWGGGGGGMGGGGGASGRW